MKHQPLPIGIARAASIGVLACWTASTGIAAAAAIYSDDNFASYPTGWTVSAGADTAAGIAPAVAPIGGANTDSLLLSDSNAAANVNASVTINGGSAYTNRARLSFDLNMAMVMQTTNTTQLNGFFMRLHDGVNNSSHSAVTLQGTRAAGAGDSLSRFAYSGANGVTVGYFDPDAWYHLEIALPALPATNSATNIVAVLTGLNGAQVRNLSANVVSSLSVTQALGNLISDYETLIVRSGNGDTYFTDAKITNIRLENIPDAPVAAAATAVDHLTFTANWANSADATNYLLDVAYDNAFAVMVSGYSNLSVGNVTSYAVTVPAVDIFYMRVRAVSPGGISPNSNVIEVPTKQAQGQNKNGGSPYAAPATLYVGDSATMGVDTWGSIAGNWGRGVVVIDSDADLDQGGRSGAWGAFDNADYTELTSPQFTNAGTWYWGVQMDYGASYGTNFWLVRDESTWSDLYYAGTNANLTVAVTALGDPTGLSAEANIGSPSYRIDVGWTKWNSRDVMVVRSTDASFGTPVPGAIYATGQSIAGDTIVYKGGGTGFTDAGLTPATTYFYRLYSENYGYYSAGAGTNTTTAPLPALGVLYTDNNFVDYPAAWSAQTSSVNQAATVAAIAPTNGTDSQSLNLTDTANTGNIDMKASFGPYTGAANVRITFDFRMNHHLIEAASQYNVLRFALLSSSDQSAGGVILGAHNGGGTSNSQFSFSNESGAPTTAYLQPGQWYHYTMVIPGVGVAGSITSSVTGTEGAQVYSGEAPFGSIGTSGLAHAKNNALANYAKLRFYQATDDSYLNAYIANIRIEAVSDAPASGYEAFVTQITNASLRGYSDDAESAPDGYVNLLEYSTGGDPNNPDAVAQMRGTTSNGVLKLIFSRNTNATDVTFFVEAASALANGTPWSVLATNASGSWGGATNIVETGSNPVTVTASDVVPSAPQRAMRLRVTRP